MNKKSATLLSLLSVYGDLNNIVLPEAKKERPCLQCNKLHSHNNSFCSAECCKIYKLNNKVKNDYKIKM
jgi:hypothetical protein